jgi:tRNA pseudouridine38-40 synthase
VALRTIKLVVEYDGSELAGWQRQKNGPSVQEHLERCLEAMVGEPVEVVGASRTDAGVHALGQVAHVCTRNQSIPEHGFRRGLNSLLPPAIAVVAASTVGADFHARFSAQGKRYVYQVLARPDRSPLLRARAWHRPHELAVERMRRATPPLIGRHDFSAFRAAGCGAAHAVRRVTGIDIRRDGDLIAIEVRGEAFLRNMVRILAGTLVEVGEKRRDPEDIARVLESRDRREAGITAPACGLTLVEVLY